MELTGVAASSGYAMGYAFVLRSRVQQCDKIVIDSRQIGLELERFEIAVRQTEDELLQISKQLNTSCRESEAEMVEVLLELLKDDEFYLRISHKISKNSLQAETAVSETTDEIVARVQKLNDMYLVER
jgi:phosphotransferase system enzyme I (PtsI)